MSSQSSEDPDLETFGPLLSISETSLINLAIKIRTKTSNSTVSAGRLIRRISGSYNLVHIIQLDDDFKLVVRVPATGWGDGLTATAAQAIESQVATLRLLASKTILPVPEVYAFDTTTNNLIGAPYICMSFVPGRTLSSVWFYPSLSSLLGDRRLQTLTTIARCMAQLAQFSFPKIGSIHQDNKGELIIGPCYDWKEQEDGSIRIIASGPYDTVAEYLKDHFAVPVKDKLKNSPWVRAESMVTEVALKHLPVQDPSEGFVLAPPDFDSQNIMADDQGNLTGILDRDLVQTLPRCVGYTRYPGWITRDWDPLMYGWPRSDSENSPEELERYRIHYNNAMGEALRQSGDWKFTRNSHIWEAIWIAALNSMNRLEICCKLVKEATSTCNDMDDARKIMYEIGTDDKDWPKVKGQLEDFLAFHQPT